MGLFSSSQIDKINQVAAKSKTLQDPIGTPVSKTVNQDLADMSQKVVEYFTDSPAILITTLSDLHDYVDKCIDSGYAGIDTETTGLDRIKDTIVGASLYYPGGTECYIPMKHLVPIFDTPYKNQLTYEEVGSEFQRLADSDIKLIFANADYDLSMIYKDLKVDFCKSCYYDVILAWRCLKEDEKDNSLKGLYNKYCLKGSGDPMKFRDFFTPTLFPYSKPEVAKLYAANDAKITYELFKWQLPYVTKDNVKCKRNHLESIADLIWNVEIPLIQVCQHMHRVGIYLDKDVSKRMIVKYREKRSQEALKLSKMVDEEIQKSNYTPGLGSKRPFVSGADFNSNSTLHVKYLLYTIMDLPQGKKGTSTDKTVLSEFHLPITDQILNVRSYDTLISTFVEKLPKATTSDSRIHACFKQIGAATGRFSSESPNLQNIPSHATDIRHMFRATPGYVMLSSDYSQQEPKITAFVSGDPKMISAFQEGRDIYATIASLSFNVPYEQCLEFHPETHEYQPDGKARRGEAKTIVLGITYGRSVVTIADQLFGSDDSLSPEEKISRAQGIYDAVLNAFPRLKSLMVNAQKSVKKLGYTETILGRRRHIPDMQLPEFEFKALKGYVNPDIDPLDPNTLKDKSQIPERIVNQLKAEFSSYKYFGQIAKRTRELYEKGIRVINNRPKITDASRQVVNSIIQGSAADMTKLAMLMLENNEEWKNIGGRLLVPVHDELICEVPMDKYEEGGKLLSKIMSDAGSFLPFPINCDVETSLRWYGLSYPCVYPEPSSLDNLDKEHIKWVQYMLHECEYELPVFKDSEGNKPRGDEALGVSGIVSEEYESAISDYKNRYKITSDIDFIEHIKNKVIYGVI